MYYLKYRPATIDEIDNEAIRASIQNLFQADTIPHALMLTGQKGTGKTSIARIIARHVNELAADESIAQSSDIVEMDAASNRGIDEVKSLIREASFLPMSGKYRVFIIDECHMITNDAFNALLKTLEEPPETTLFILATTNIEKVPKTIVSRCSIIQFARAKNDDIIHMLKRIAKGEKLTLPDDLYELIATHADGSFRDAAKLMEDLVIQQATTAEQARKYLGVAGEQTFLSVLEKGDVKTTLQWFKDFVEQGANVKPFLEDVLQQLRLALLTKSGVEGVNVPTTLTSSQLSRLIKLMSEAYLGLKSTPIESIPVEIAIVDFYNEKK
jgi:DNA polymerase-3 subunit gamma/tau